MERPTSIYWKEIRLRASNPLRMATLWESLINPILSESQCLLTIRGFNMAPSKSLTTRFPEDELVHVRRFQSSQSYSWVVKLLYGWYICSLYLEGRFIQSTSLVLQKPGRCSVRYQAPTWSWASLDIIKVCYNNRGGVISTVKLESRVVRGWRNWLLLTLFRLGRNAGVVKPVNLTLLAVVRDMPFIVDEDVFCSIGYLSLMTISASRIHDLLTRFQVWIEKIYIWTKRAGIWIRHWKSPVWAIVPGLLLDLWVEHSQRYIGEYNTAYAEMMIQVVRQEERKCSEVGRIRIFFGLN
jgi:hypothetical protein